MLIRLRSFYLSGQRVLSLDLIISTPLYKWGPQAQDSERSCLVNKRLHVAQESVAERHIKEIQDSNLSYYLTNSTDVYSYNHLVVSDRVPHIY